MALAQIGAILLGTGIAVGTAALLDAAAHQGRGAVDGAPVGSSLTAPRGSPATLQPASSQHESTVRPQHASGAAFAASAGSSSPAAERAASASRK
jgi:hypothetical protein